MYKFNNAKHAKKNLLLLFITAIVVSVLIAMPLLAQGFSDKANAEPLSPQDCEQITVKSNSIESDLMTCYEAFGHAYNGEYNFIMLSEILGGDCIVSGKYADSKAKVLDTFNKNASTDNKDILLNTWNNYYAAINACNVFIEQYSTGDESTTPYVAEAFTLRGICYFDLARLFENIPLVLTSNQSMSVQASPDDVYSQLISDLWFGSKNAPDFIKDDEGFNKTNRISKWAAKAYVARASMFYWSYYKHIAELAQATPPDIPLREPALDASLSKANVVDILKESIYSGVLRLEDNNANSFASSVANNRYWQYQIKAEPGDIDSLLGTADDWMGWFNNREYLFSVNYNSETLSEKNNWISKLGIYNASQELRYSGEGMLSASPRSVAKANMEETGGGYKDPRVDTPPSLSWSYLDAEGINSNVGITWDKNINDWANCTGFIMAKYCPVCYYEGTPAYINQPVVLIRYADVLLMVAELTGDPAFINQIQHRAGIPEKPYTLNNIQYERETEFLFEGVNYWDDVRWGRALQKYESLQKDISVYNNGQWVLDNDYDISNYINKHFLPIPETMVAKYKYRQNPGW